MRNAQTWGGEGVVIKPILLVSLHAVSHFRVSLLNAKFDKWLVSVSPPATVFTHLEGRLNLGINSELDFIPFLSIPTPTTS
jgi:hypothetical protein